MDLTCEHLFVPDDNNKFDGHGHCLKCCLWKPFIFMEETLKKAKNIAIKAYEGKKNKFGEPYIKHSQDVYIYVSWLVQEWNMENALPMCCAAWLHDVLDNCPNIKEQEIIDAVGEKSFILIKELTNTFKNKKNDLYYLSIASNEAKIIKLVDRICNLRDYQYIQKDLIETYLIESRVLLDVLRGTHEQLEIELQRQIDILEKKLYEDKPI